MTPEHKETLEQILDRYGLEAMLTELAQICSEKGEHVRTNWQDEPLAKNWDARMMYLDNVAAKVKRWPT